MPNTAAPPSMSSLHPEGISLCCPPIPPRSAPPEGTSAGPCRTSGPDHRAGARARRKNRGRGRSRRPNSSGEVLEELQTRRQLEHSVAVIEGLSSRVDGAVPHADPHVAHGIDDRCGSAHPHGPLAVARRCVDREDRWCPSGLADGDHPSPIGRAVSEVPAKAEDDLSVVECQPGPLQQRGQDSRRVGRPLPTSRSCRSGCSARRVHAKDGLRSPDRPRQRVRASRRR